jgi:hypothetical protein
MRVANLLIVAFCAVVAMLGVAQRAEARPVCGTDLTATIGPSPDMSIGSSAAGRRAARLCPSVAKSVRRLPICSAGFVTCRGTCSGGAEWFTWQCCDSPDGFPPQCGINCSKEFAGCFAQ